MRCRPATDRDRDAVLALGVLEEVVWFGAAEASPEEVGAWIDDEGGLGEGVVADEDGRVLGFTAPGRRSAVYVADPARTDAVADALLPWLARQRAVVEVLTFGADHERTAAFERHGLRHLRSGFSMHRPDAAGPLAAAIFPPGVDVAPYRLGDDDEAVHRLIYVDAAWTAVPGHADRDLEGWRLKERASGTRFLARRDGRPVGWVAGRLVDSGRGSVTTLAVAVAERGRGLGRALLLHAFADLEAAGARGLGLDVEAHNETALGLYRSVGLGVEREWRTYTTARDRPGP